MQPKSALEIAISPEGLIILPIAIVIDLIGIVLVCFLLDDFEITDIIGWIFIGGWSLIRSQVVPTAEISMPSMEEKRGLAKEFQSTQKTAAEAEKIAKETQQARKMANAAKWAKRIKWLEFIPYVGALPLWTVSVYMTIKYS